MGPAFIGSSYGHLLMSPLGRFVFCLWTAVDMESSFICALAAWAVVVEGWCAVVCGHLLVVVACEL